MSILNDIEKYELDDTNKLVKFDARDINIAVINHMSVQCKQSLHIISRKLDPMIFGTKIFIAACKKLALSNHKAQIRIIVSEPESIIKYKHGLLTLAGRLSSSIVLRKCHPSFVNYNACMLIADDAGYIHRENEAIYTGTANFKDHKLCQKFLKQFAEMWELAIPDANLRKLYI